MKKFQFKVESTADMTRLLISMSQKDIESITFSFSKGQKEVEVRLNASSKLSLKKIACHLSLLKNSDIVERTIQEIKEDPKPRTDVEKYKFRAECYIDVEKLLRIVRHGEIASVTIFFDGIPDVTVLLHMDEGVQLNTVRNYMRLVEDSHVMWQTVQPEHLYTGEREDIEENDLFSGPFRLS
jgi:hypothetical protein